MLSTFTEKKLRGLGRRVARSKTTGGETIKTTFVLNLVGEMERILCEADEAGAIKCWYVHGHDLSFSLDREGNLVCYHADAQANVIALTGHGGGSLAQYAYMPYGRLLGMTNVVATTTLANQPFTFVGSYGVMEELGGLFFMRARYYYSGSALFLSADPRRNIGPGWKANAYSYTSRKPLLYHDADGLFLKEIKSKVSKLFSKVIQTVSGVKKQTTKPSPTERAPSAEKQPRPSSPEELVKNILVKSFLDSIAVTEGTSNDPDGGYSRVVFGTVISAPLDPKLVGKSNVTFSDYSRHPQILVKVGPKYAPSTAAGRYQILYSTWSELGLDDFTPHNQDIAAIKLLQSRGAIDPLLEGNPEQAALMANRVWASLPDSPYGQPTVEMDEFVRIYYHAVERNNENENN